MRITATNPRNQDWNQYLFPCDCNASHYLHLEWWKDEDWEGYLEITGTVWTKSLWQRVKAAITVLRGRHHYLDGVVLTKETTVDLIQTLNGYITEREKKDATVQPANKV